MSMSSDRVGQPTTADSFPLAEIREGEMNVKTLKSGKRAIIFRHGERLSVYSEVCPHLGADLSTGKHCAKDGTIQCPWHGYVFSTDDGRFTDNPNDRLMAVLRAPTKHYRPEKTPKYKLIALPFYVREQRLFIGKEETA
jgi:nitrite reductase/ring-hydroxylating ferredoxin subunit